MGWAGGCAARENLFGMMAERPLVFATAGMLGLVVNAATWAVIQYTSSLTLKVAATVKNAVIVYLGHLVFHEAVSSQQVRSSALSALTALSSIAGWGHAQRYGFDSGLVNTGEPLPQTFSGGRWLWTCQVGASSLLRRSFGVSAVKLKRPPLCLACTEGHRTGS